MNTSAKKPEPTLDELLADPMMTAVLHYSRTTPDLLRALLREARQRLAQVQAADKAQPLITKP